MEKKLPVLATLMAALDLCREHLSYAVKILTPWFLILTIAPYLLTGLSGGIPEAGTADEFQLWHLFSVILYTVGWASIAVLWHWRILRDDSQSGMVVTFDRRVWFYVLRGVLIAIVILGILLLMVFPLFFAFGRLPEDFENSLAFFTFANIMLVPLGIVASRLSVALPAIALGVSNVGLIDAWARTRGNSFRLFWVMALPIVPLYLLSSGLEAFGASEIDLYRLSPPFMVLHLIFQILDFALGLLGLTALSLTYAFFVERSDKIALQET